MSRCRLGVGGLAVAVVLTFACAALRADVRVEPVGQWGGGSSAVTIVDDIAYLGVGPRVAMLDMSTPASPVFLGQSPVLLGYVMGIAVQGDYAYVADRYNGLQVIDISDPSNMTWVGGASLDGPSWDVGVSGDFAYLAVDDKGLHIFDVSDPRRPVHVATHPTSFGTTGLFVTDRYAYAATMSSVDIFDISDPHHATRVGVYPGGCWDLVVRYNMAYLADWHGMTIIDVSDPEQPSWVSTWQAPHHCEDVVVCGDYALLGGWTTYIVNTANPWAPQCVGLADLKEWADAVAATSDYMLVAEWWAGMEVFDVSDPRDPRKIAAYDRANHAFGVRAKGDHAYVTGYTPGVQIIDVSEPREPRRVAVYPRGNTLAVGDRYAYVAHGAEPASLDVVDVANPAVPTLLGTTSFDGYGAQVAIVGNLACVAVHIAGVVFVDTSDPRAPRVIETCDTGNAWGVVAADDYAYVADVEAGLVVFDISNPQQPRLVGSSPTTYVAKCIAMGDGHVYVGLARGFDIFDLTEPSSPALVGHYPVYMWADAIEYHDGLVYAVPRLAVVDVSDPAAPRAVGDYRWASYAQGVDFDGGLLYVANDSVGLWSFAIHQLGDLNCDDVVDEQDVDPFVLALANPDRYAQQHPDCDIMNGDINRDGQVDFGDINPFVSLLTGGF